MPVLQTTSGASGIWMGSGMSKQSVHAMPGVRTGCRSCALPTAASMSSSASTSLSW